jgi:hypothetical protein
MPAINSFWHFMAAAVVDFDDGKRVKHASQKNRRFHSIRRLVNRKMGKQTCGTTMKGNMKK